MSETSQAHYSVDSKKHKFSIVHLITTLNMGGAEMMLYKTLTCLDRKRFPSLVVGMTDLGKIGVKIKALGIPVETLGMKLGRPTLRGIWHLYHILKRSRPEILQTYMYHANLLGLLVGKMTKVNSIVWSLRCSEMDLSKYRLLTRLVVRLGAWFSPKVDLILSNSHAGLRHHQQIGYRNSSTRIIANGFDLGQFKPNEKVYADLRNKLRLNNNDLLIGLVARWDPMKDHATFIKAASIVANKKHNVYFLLIGKNVEESNQVLNQLLGRNGLKGKVFLKGFVDDIQSINMALDIACSSSAFGEGFSNTIAEAMACGVPCVVTDVGDSAWLVDQTGRVVPPRNPEALAGALRELIQNPELRRNLGNNARKRIHNYFNIVDIVDELEKTYDNVLLQNKYVV